MELVEITEDNVEDYSDFIDVDLQENLERNFFVSLGVENDDGTPLGAIVYEYLDYDSDNDTRSRIHSLKTSDDKITEILLNEYKENISAEEVTTSLFETEYEQLCELLKAHGFNTGKVESPAIRMTVGDIKKIAETAAGKKFPDYLLALEDVSLLQYRTFIKNCIISGRYGILEDLGYIPMSWYEGEISAVSIADEKIDGAFLIRKTPSGVLIPCLFTAFGVD
ncbi:MAG: hypothetical protein J6N76_02815, partial [Lachnospiraceae bacterium]|nr:hypothetical protein [Lachnospiraceae bacterium]